MQESKLNWYVVYTKHCWEKKTASLLEKKSFESYCPFNKVKKQWHDRKKTVLQPLFTSYVFVRTTAQQLVFVKDVAGVVNFVHWLGKPAIVRDEEIRCIKDFLEEHPAVDLEKMDVNINDNVKIMRGAFMNKEGIVVQVNTHTVKIEIPSMGYALVAKVSKTNISISSKKVVTDSTLALKKSKSVR